MLKMIGAAMIFCGCAACGVSAVERQRRRVEVQDSLCTALTVMRLEICDRMAPMPEVFDRLHRELPQPAAALFDNLSRGMNELGQKTLAEIWREALDKTDGLLLTPQEELILCELGLSLGKYRVEAQSAAIVCTLKKLERCADEAREVQRRDGRLHTALGVAAGVFAVILLI